MCETERRKFGMGEVNANNQPKKTRNVNDKKLPLNGKVVRSVDEARVSPAQ